MKKVVLVLFCVGGVFAQENKIEHKYFVLQEYEVGPCYTDRENPEDQTSIRCGNFFSNLWGASFKPYIGFKNEVVRPGASLTQAEKDYFSAYINDISKGKKPDHFFVYARGPVVNGKTNVLAMMPVDNIDQTSNTLYGLVTVPIVANSVSKQLATQTINHMVKETVAKDVVTKSAPLVSESTWLIGTGWVLATLTPFVADGRRGESPALVEKYGKRLKLHHVIDLPLIANKDYRQTVHHIKEALTESTLPKNGYRSVEQSGDLDHLWWSIMHFDQAAAYLEKLAIECLFKANNLGDELCGFLCDLVDKKRKPSFDELKQGQLQEDSFTFNWLKNIINLACKNNEVWVDISPETLHQSKSNVYEIYCNNFHRRELVMSVRLKREEIKSFLERIGYRWAGYVQNLHGDYETYERSE